MEQKDFPMCDTNRRIPWSVAERAYEEYVKKWGKYSTLERIAERGGFYQKELDEFYPGWREDVEEIYLLRKEVKNLRELSTRYDDEYVEKLEGIAEAMRASMETMLFIVSPEREPLCGNIEASNQAEFVLDQYHRIKRDYSND